MLKCFLLLPGLALATTGSSLAEDLITSSADGSIRLTGGIGAMNIKANELVYDGDTRISHLIWESKGVTIFTASLAADLPNEWTLTVSGQAGTGGDSDNLDYDWLKPAPGGGSKFSDWSDRSHSPDTNLDYYFDGSIEIGHALYQSGGTTLGFSTGFRYTDMKWSAYGGDYVYSSKHGFRDQIGSFPDGEKGLSYRQRWPVAFLGSDLQVIAGDWTFAAAVQGGLAISASDIDDHWITGVRYYDNFELTPAINATLSADYALNHQIDLYLSGSFDGVFRIRGNTRANDGPHGASNFYPDGAGGDYYTSAISLGLKGRF